MIPIENIRNNILTNNYDDYKQKIIRIKKSVKNINIPNDSIDKLASDLQKLSYVTILANSFANKETINTKGFLKKLTKEINTVTKFNFTTLDVFNLMKESIKVQKEYNKLNKNIYLENNLVDLKGGFLSTYYAWREETSTWSKVLDVVTTIFDLLGIVPGLGMPFDAANIVLTALHGKYLLAAITLISLVPVIGTLGPLLKAMFKQYTRGKIRRSQNEKLDKLKKELAEARGESNEEFEDEENEENEETENEETK